VTFVVGLRRDERGRAALNVAAMLARSTGEDLVVCAVVPAPWPAGVARVDAEYQAYLERIARDVVDEARARLSGAVKADFAVVRARSVSGGLLDVVEERAAGLLVIGSSAAGVLGRVAFGSVAERLLHSSPVPVTLTPRGFRCSADVAVRRVTAAYVPTVGGGDVVLAAAGFAARVGVTLRLASFAVRPRTPLTAGVGSRAEAGVVQEWSSEVERAQRESLERVARLPRVPSALDAVVGRGEDWASALEDVDWDDGDVLVVGSSGAAPLARVFLGSRSSKIVRSSPVPVVALPRGAVEDLALVRGSTS
jgi:nucleotide-binding universal stress UspA family protein